MTDPHDLGPLPPHMDGESIYSGAEMRAYAREQVQRALGRGVPAGWRLVPTIPTPEMQRAGEEAFALTANPEASWAEHCGNVYREMIDTAPPPEPDTPQDGDPFAWLLRDAQARPDLCAATDGRPSFVEGLEHLLGRFRWLQREVRLVNECRLREREKHRAMLAAATSAPAVSAERTTGDAQAGEPADCADNDSPWLICKPCAAAGKCAMRSAPPSAPAPGVVEALERLMRHFPTDTDMAEAGWSHAEIEEACSAHDAARAALAAHTTEATR